MHSRYLNEQMVLVLKAIGYDVGFCRGEGQYLYDEGQYLYDREGTRYLDLLSGFGVFAIGRNHPALRRTLKSVLDSDLPNLVQMDVSTLAGILAERILAHVPYLDKAMFLNSGFEAVEAAIKFARAATGRPGIIYCEHAFHGLSYGALSLNGDDIFRNGFGPLLPDCVRIPFNNLVALERALHSRTMAAFIVEPIQGKGVNVPDEDYLKSAADLCRRHGTLFVADEVQTGLGRTGRFLAIEHWNVEPDMVLLAKTLSGGHVPVGAILARRKIFDKVFDRMERAVAHGSTFGNNDLTMAAGITTLEVLTSVGLIENAARTGEHLLHALRANCNFFASESRHSRELSLHLGFDMDRNECLSIHVGFQGCFDAVANFVRLSYANVAGNDKMEINESHASGMASPHVMRLNCASRVLTDQFLDACHHLRRRRFVHKSASPLAYHFKARPQNVDAD